ncbi:hypothetical protein KUTeg_000756 [Tegillarca granosa]|uniref:C2H2-type domain-containing protein n=1 Tax=Tegillarca granosa TaxID=220873 RepID=A0ABQ9G199_TEGGR|nr:hypothetical protein KUTeg_000756 [Tegillarca granosa]
MYGTDSIIVCVPYMREIKKKDRGYLMKKGSGVEKDNSGESEMGQNDTSFPYGLSGVAMPNYGYPGELYQFTSNGYPRKSRTCSYCGKVFTRSTTRRYHEKRCPLLRAAVCSLIPEEKKLQGTQISRNGHSQGQSSVSSSVLSRGNLDNSTLNSGIDKLTSQPVTSLSSQSNNLTTSTQQITSPYLDNSRVDDSISSVIKPHETSFTDQDVIATSSSVHGHDLTPTRLTPDSQGSPHDQKSVDARSFSLSPFQMPAGLDLRQSPSRGKEDGHLLLSDDGNRGEFKVENGNTLDLGGQESEMFPEDIDNDGAGNNDLNFTSPVGQDTSFMDIANTIPTSMSLSQENVTESTNVNDEKDTDLGVQSNNISNDASNVSSKSCGVCGKSFESSWQLHVHEQIHKKFKPYACRFCGQRFSKAALRITHERSHVGDSNHICAVCGTSFPKKESLRIHMKKNHQEGPWLCRHCGKAMLTQTELCEHLETHDLPANEKESLQYMTSSPLGPLSEGESSYGEGDIGEMNDSEILSDSNESPEQESPGENLAIKEDENNTLEMELCTICGRDFPKAHMPYHLKAHDGQKPYECPICGKRFGYKNNMKSHIKLHAGIKPYQCNVCGAKFTRGSTLRRHARRHGISAESVWDLFVRNGNTSTHNLESGQSRESSTPSNVISSRILTSTPNMVNSKIKPEMDISNWIC